MYTLWTVAVHGSLWGLLFRTISCEYGACLMTTNYSTSGKITQHFRVYNIVIFWKTEGTVKIEQRHGTTAVMSWNLMLMVNESQNLCQKTKSYRKYYEGWRISNNVTPRPRKREKDVKRQQGQSLFHERGYKLSHKVGRKDALIRVYKGWAEIAWCDSINKPVCRQPISRQVIRNPPWSTKQARAVLTAE
jgi:hypothetical protein